MAPEPRTDAEAGAGGPDAAAMGRALERIAGLLDGGRFGLAFGLAEDFQRRFRTQTALGALVEVLTGPADGSGALPRAAALRRYAGARPRDPWAAAALAAALMERDPAGAVAASERLARLGGGRGWMRYVRAEALREAGLARRACAEYEAAYASAPQLWKARGRRAQLELGGAGLPRALRLLREATRGLKGFDRAEARAWEGLLRLSAGRAAGAVADFTAALRLESRFPLARAWRGLAWLRLGRRAEARRDLDQAIASDPSLSRAHAWRAQLLLEEGDLESCARDLDRAERLDPGCSDLLAARAGLLLARGRRKAALGLIRDLRRREPGHRALRGLSRRARA